MAQISWIGTTDGNWNTASNWSTATVPGANDDVIINVTSANPTITIPKGVNVTVKSITSEEKLVVDGGLTVTTGVSTLNGELVVNAGKYLQATGTANLTANGATTVNGANLYAKNGGILNLPKLTSYTATANGYDANYIQTEDAGSKIALPALQTLIGADKNTSALYVKALNGSEIDLGATKAINSGQTVIEVNGQNSKITANNLENIAGRPSLYAKNGAILQLPALLSYTATTNGYDANYIQTEGAGSKISLPILQTLTGASAATSAL